jgi:hypothetical protein
MPREPSTTVKVRIKHPVLATIDAAAEKAGMNRSRFMRAAALGFNPEPTHTAAQPRKESAPAKPEAIPASRGAWYPTSKCPHGYQNSFVCERAGGGCRR